MYIMMTSMLKYSSVPVVAQVLVHPLKFYNFGNM